jgi:nucleoid-associated protein YgaU
MRHVVKEGEDLWSIAKQHYGSGRYFQAIWDANRDRVASPESIPAGTELRLPTAADMARAAAPVTPPAAAPAAAMRPRTNPAPDPAVQRSSFEIMAPEVRTPGTPTARAPTAARPDEPAPRPRPTALEFARSAGEGADYPIHVVGRFESLRSIARDRLGDSRRAAEILALNRDTLRSSDRPVPGQHLRLPKDATPLRHGR